ncbi:hypothetical protein BaRGS_00028508 [Batillaria attramentaria]|uniref:Uncharacterized protein n=1 Tax=Batillaria attramentaria TaxID=370345 RepID=A0ABD0JYT5_9CAEN
MRRLTSPRFLFFSRPLRSFSVAEFRQSPSAEADVLLSRSSTHVKWLDRSHPLRPKPQSTASSYGVESDRHENDQV